MFYVTIPDAHIGSPKSLHTLFDKYFDYMLVNLNKIVWSELPKILSFHPGCHFGRRFCNWNNCLMLEDYHLSVFHKLRTSVVTRLKIAPNIADPIRIREKKNVILKKSKTICSQNNHSFTLTENNFKFLECGLWVNTQLSTLLSNQILDIHLVYVIVNGSKLTKYKKVHSLHVSAIKFILKKQLV